MKNGVYLLSFQTAGNNYERRVLVEDGFYRFTDERGEPLYQATYLSVAVAKSSGSTFKFIDSVYTEPITCIALATPKH